MSNGFPPPADSDRAGAASPVDWDLALGAVGGDVELLRSVTEVMLVDAPRQIASMQSAVTNGDSKELRRAAHTLKGALRYFGATEAADWAEQIEGAGQRGAIGEAPERIEKLTSAMAAVKQALLDYLRNDSAEPR